jgi:predicted TIM-barrel fold metal-dependent hydrolase
MSSVETIIDSEHHVIVEQLDDLAPYLRGSWLQRLRMGEFAMPRSGPHPAAELEARPGQGGADPGAAARALDPAVSHVLLVPSQPLVASGWLGHTMASVFCAAVNDHVVARWLPADPRFHFAIVVSSHDGEAAAEEIRRLGSHPAAAAVCLSPIAVNMGQRHYHPIYSAASELGLPVIVHPGGFEANVVGPAVLGGVGPRTPEDTFCLLPQVAMSNISSLVFDGVFQRFEQLRVVFAGFGFGWAPPLLWRMDAEWRGLRIEVPWLTRAPSEVAAQHIRFVADAAVEHDEPGTWALAGMLADEALLWGSDTPFGAGDATRVVDAVPEALRGRVAFANAGATFPRLGAAATVGT